MSEAIKPETNQNTKMKITSYTKVVRKALKATPAFARYVAANGHSDIDCGENNYRESVAMNGTLRSIGAAAYGLGYCGNGSTHAMRRIEARTVMAHTLRAARQHQVDRLTRMGVGLLPCKNYAAKEIQSVAKQ